MSKPLPGTYVIYNRVLGPSGEKLAITFNGQGVIATVTPLSYNGPQKWIIADYSDGVTQTVTPTTNSSLQAGWGADGVTVIPAGGYVWNIRGTDGGATIKNGSVTVNWGVAKASGGVDVTIGSDTGNEKQRWIFERV